MLAVLSQRIEAAFGRRLSIATLFQTPTMEGQATLLESSPASTRNGLIQHQPHGARSPLFWLHPPAHIVHISEALGARQPLFGIALTDAELEKLGPEPSIESIAALHARTILDARPRGPLFVGGLCTGGIVAFETAAQLQSAGRHVALLVLLDSRNPAYSHRAGGILIEISKACFYLKRAIMQAQYENQATLQQRFRRMISLHWQFGQTEDDEIETILGQHKTDAAAYRYKPPRYTGDVLLIQPKDRPASVDHAVGWRAVATGKLITQEIACHHDQLLDPENAAALASVIVSHLDQAAFGRMERQVDRIANLKLLRSAQLSSLPC